MESRFLFRIILSTVAVILGGLVLAEQPSASVNPSRFTSRSTEIFREALTSEVPSLRFGLGVPEEFSLGDAELPKETSIGAGDIAGVRREIRPEVMPSARWLPLEGGKSIWQLRIRSNGARAVRVHFEDFDAGDGRVWLHPGNSSEVMGPYTGKGIFEDGEFWSDFVFGDSLVIEYEAAYSPRSAGEQPPFRVTALGHLFSDLRSGAGEGASEVPGLGLLAARTGNEAASTCHVDAACYPEWADTAKSVGLVVFEDRGIERACSGTLLATRNRTAEPLFLTAGHCINNQPAARSAQVFWLFQSAACNGRAPTRLQVPRTLGGLILTAGGPPQSDFSLLRLNGVPDGVTFSGWDTANFAIGTRFTAIHHPEMEHKRITFFERADDIEGPPGTNPDGYYTVRATEGRTELGSSGSPLFHRPGVIAGVMSYGPRYERRNQVCEIEPFYNGFGRFSAQYPYLRNILEGSGTPGQPPTPPDRSTELVAGRSAPVRLPPVTGATLFAAEGGFRIRVPEGALRLEVTINVDGPVGMIIRRGATPVVQAGRPVGDYTSQGFTGKETILLTRQSTPPLAPGLYYIGLAVLGGGQPVTGTIVASVTTGGGLDTPTPSTSDPQLLTSGIAQPVTIPPSVGPNLMNGMRGFRIQVPERATLLEVQIRVPNPLARFDLYARYGRDVEITSGRIVADHMTGGTGGVQTLLITPASSPSLRAGTYYIAIGAPGALFPLVATISATATAVSPGAQAPAGSGLQLVSSEPRGFQLAPVATPALLNGRDGFWIAVPPGSERLEVRLRTNTPGADLDLFLRHNAFPAVTNGRLETDYQSSGPDGNEAIIVTTSSDPPIRPGFYYVGLAVFTKGVAVEGTLTAVVTGAALAAERRLESGSTVELAVPARESAVFLSGPFGYSIEVPAGAAALEVKLNLARPADVEIYARRNDAPALDDGRVVADYVGSGSGATRTIMATTAGEPPLQPGVYRIAIALKNPGEPLSGTLTATVLGDAPSASGPVALRLGVTHPFRYAAVSAPAVFRGNQGFVVDVPDTRRALRLTLTSSSGELGMFVRHGQDVDLFGAGLVADYSLTSATQSGRLTISPNSTPPLRTGRYFIALSTATVGNPISGTLTAAIVDP